MEHLTSAQRGPSRGKCTKPGIDAGRQKSKVRQGDWSRMKGGKFMMHRFRFWPPSRLVVRAKVSGSWAHHTEEVGMSYWCPKKKKFQKKKSFSFLHTSVQAFPIRYPLGTEVFEFGGHQESVIGLSWLKENVFSVDVSYEGFCVGGRLILKCPRTILSFRTSILRRSTPWASQWDHRIPLKRPKCEVARWAAGRDSIQNYLGGGEGNPPAISRWAYAYRHGWKEPLEWLGIWGNTTRHRSQCLGISDGR